MNALKISLRFGSGSVRSTRLLSNELRQLSVKSNLANFQSIAVARNYSQISLQKVRVVFKRISGFSAFLQESAYYVELRFLKTALI